MSNPQNLTQSKFSIPSVENPDPDPVYAEMEKFVYHLAWQNDNPNNVMMEAEEIAAELLAELAKGMKAYNGLPLEERKAVIRRMLDNRMGELKYRFYGTHRKAAKLTVSLEADEAVESLASDAPNPEQVLSSKERVEMTRSKLSKPAQAVFDAVVFGDTRLTNVMLASLTRAFATYQNPTIKLRPWQVADALLMEEKVVVKAFAEIKRAYGEVCHG